MPILRVRNGFTLTHGQSVFLAGDIIECSEAFARGVAHMTETAPASETKRAKLIRDPINPASARPPAAA